MFFFSQCQARTDPALFLLQAFRTHVNQVQGEDEELEMDDFVRSMRAKRLAAIVKHVLDWVQSAMSDGLSG